MSRGLRFVSKSKKRLTLVGVLVIALASAIGAIAYWTSQGSGSASAGVGTLTAPGKPSVPVTAGTVNLSWTAATVSGGGTVKYHVERRTNPGSTWTDVCGSTDAAPITGLSCSNTPGSGTFVYRVTSRYASWHTVGAESDPVTANGDTTAPVVTLTAPANNSATTNTKPTFSGAAGTATGDLAAITVRIYAGSTTGGTLVQTLNATASAGAWSVVPTTALADGTYTGQASQSDSAGNTGTSSANTFKIDTTAPGGAYTFPAANGFYGSTTWNAGCPTVGFCGTATDATSGVASVQIQIKNPAGLAWDGSTFRTGNRMVTATVSAGTWSYGFNTASFTGDGVYTTNGTITDNVGNTFTLAQQSFTIDSVAPVVSLTAPVNGARTSDTTPTFTGAAGTAAGDLATVTVKIYSGSTTGGTLVQTVNTTASGASWLVAAPTPLADGTYTAQASQSDSAGNTGTSSANTFVVDTTAPSVTLTAPTAASTTADQTPTISGTAGTATGDLAAITVKIYNGTGTGGTIAQTLTPTASGGSWTTTAATLAAGTYTVQAAQSDSVGNTGTSSAVTFTINTTAPTFTAKPSTPSANTAPSFSFTHGVYGSFQCSLDAAAFAACTSPKALSSLGSGSHTFAVTALDSQGNATQTASYTWTVDTAAPTISAKPANPSAATTSSFTFAQSSYTSYECSLDGAAFAACTSTKSYATADGAHTFAVKTIDADGIRTLAASYGWTQTTGAPTITAKPATTSANKTPVFSFSESGYTSFQCKIDLGSFAACTSGSASASQADGSHTFTVRAVDGNNVTTTAAAYTWTINTVAPAVSSVAGMTAGNTYAATSAAFNFSHSVYTAFQCFLDANTAAACVNGKTFSSLIDGSHTVTANALDADSIATSNGTFTWTVKNAAPTITSQPANPTNSTSATFNFNETPYTLFQCQRDGLAAAACNGGTVSYSSLTGGPGTTHTFKVHAVDSIGGATADQTYTWVIDTNAPALSGVTYVDLPSTGPGNGNDTITGSTEAGSTVTATFTACTGTGCPTLNSPFTLSNAPASFTLSLGKLGPFSNATIVVTSKDAATNTTTVTLTGKTDAN
jgi:large repetitive protein